MTCQKTKYLIFLSLIFSLTISSCSRTLLMPSLISYKEEIFENKGIKTTGISTGLKSQKNGIKEATENALKNAGADYDILSNVEIKVKYGLFRNIYIVSGVAYKSKNILK